MKLEIKNLNVSVENKRILRDLSISFEKGKTYAIIGPNGNGKSTLLSTIMGDPNFSVDSGSVTFENKNLLEMEVFERARAGIYLGMQYPVEIPGVKNSTLVNSALTAKAGRNVSMVETIIDMERKTKDLRLPEEIVSREVNVGFSGGEKKKNEILQMTLLKPKLILLDEIDSGLDVDSIKAIAKEIRNQKSDNNIFVVISHYQEMFDIIEPDELIVIKDGSVYKKGPFSELKNILAEGFDHI